MNILLNHIQRGNNMSKGSEYRTYNKKKFDQEYDRIFGKKKTKDKEKKH